MYEKIIKSADAVAMFYRLQMNIKKEFPIRHSEMGVLIFIQKHGMYVTPLMISKFFNIAKPSVTSMISSLTKKGYLVKIPSMNDGRSYTVTLTAKGQELVDSTAQEYYKTMDLLEKKMGTKRFDEFVRLLEIANEILIEEGR